MVGSNPNGAMKFDVFTDQEWINAGDPVGRGTVQQVSSTTTSSGTKDLFGGSLVWTTNDPNGELYHIQVTNTSGQAAQFWIDAAGAGNGGLSPYSAATQTLASVSTSGAAGPTQQGPQTLPVTGNGSNLVVYLGAGLALIAAGWLTTRKATQR